MAGRLLPPASPGLNLSGYEWPSQIDSDQEDNDGAGAGRAGGAGASDEDEDEDEDEGEGEEEDEGYVPGYTMGSQSEEEGADEEEEEEEEEGVPSTVRTKSVNFLAQHVTTPHTWLRRRASTAPPHTVEHVGRRTLGSAATADAAAAATDDDDATDDDNDDDDSPAGRSTWHTLHARRTRSSADDEQCDVGGTTRH